MKRSTLLALLRVAGYHGDTAGYTRLLIEERISKAAAREAYAIGRRAKELGVPCSCSDCSRENRARS